jgi:pimeloyl-ACP methyl ester carboxylesterase
MLFGDGHSVMRFVYIHGFASSPQSRKARAFEAAMAAKGIRLEIPAMDEGDFEHLTISGQLGVLERLINGEPVRLTGSSMGGYLAALYASRHPEVDRLVMMAPAFGFAQRWKEKAVEGADLEVFHYGDKATRRVHYGLLADSEQFPANPDFGQPGLIFHGVHDDVVPVEYSRNFAAVHPFVRLVEMESDHELLDVLPQILSQAVDFLTHQL